MLSIKFWFLVASCGISIAAVNGAVKKEKAFSLFNVVTFKNDECIANTANDLRGTCYTTEECEEKGGTASGGCAAGFGTCCLFTVDECGGTARENCTYIRNEGFPDVLTGVPDTTACAFTIEKCSEEVCSLRLDFNAFNIQAGTGGSATAQDTTGACQDTFQVTLPNNEAAVIPTICGQNNDQHMFVEIGGDAMATLRFEFEEIAGMRQFEIKVTQYECGDVGTLAPPGGCLQYHTGTTGQLTTFNWAPNDAQHLENQAYDICIRQEAGFCCIDYVVCDQVGAFSLSAPSVMTDLATTKIGATGTACAKDFISIEGSSEICGDPVSFNKYCGDVLSSSEAMAAPNVGICDCSAPFAVGITTNAADAGNDHDGDADLQQSRGVCLNYRQIPCRGF